MKKILTIIALGCATIATWAQPRFTADHLVANLGDIAFQMPRTVTYTYTNTGDKPLFISSVHPSCGCTTVEWNKNAIAPGAKGEIKVTYDAAMLGTFFKEVEVFTNASAEPQYLVLQGRVSTNPNTTAEDFPISLDNIRITNNVIEFDDVNKGDHPVVELQVINTSRQTYVPQLMHLPEYLTAEYLPQSLAPGRVGRIRVKLNSNKLSTMGLTQTNIYLARYEGDRVNTDNEISVSAVLLPSFRHVNTTNAEFAPRLEMPTVKLDLGTFGKKTVLKGVLFLKNTGRTTLDIERLQVFNHATEVSLTSRTLKPGEIARLRVTVKKKYVGRDKSRMRILLITNDPENPKQTVDVILH